MFDVGYAFGRPWAHADGTDEHRQDVYALGDGREWAPVRICSPLCASLA